MKKNIKFWQFILNLHNIFNINSNNYSMSIIKNDAVFKSALTQFLRDKKINEILE